MAITTEDVVKAITFTTRMSPSVSESGDIVIDDARLPIESISADALKTVIATVSSYDELGELSVVTKTSYEVLVQGDRHLIVARGNEFSLDDSQAGLTYRLGYGSNSYVVFLALKAIEQNEGRPLRLYTPLPLTRMRDNNAPKTVFEIMAMFLRAYTLRIESTTPRAANTWAPYVDAFFFHVGYNLDAAVMPQRQLDEIVRQSRISRVRHRPTSAELDAPRRHYVADLVHHYQLGVSSESPMLEYISYYHVAEHWFESIYQDDLVEQIQSTITAPSFSYRRKKDVRDLIRKVSKAVQLRDDQLVINEQVALKLTLDRHVDLNNLRADLQNFDPSLLQAYENSTVSFSSGDRVPFSGEDRAEIIGALSRRIYKTRNSLVHSKDGAKGRFVPFSDDRELIREVPLLRFVAEQIIVSTSTLAPS